MNLKLKKHTKRNEKLLVTQIKIGLSTFLVPWFALFYFVSSRFSKQSNLGPHLWENTKSTPR
jgi:hypothetical protein